MSQSPAHNDFRSDTFTTPTPSMLEAVATATLGDSVYKEDATTNAFEQKICELTGKEAALFCVSGTLSNQIALRSHLMQPPHSILCDYRGHVYVHEAGGLATLSQAMVTPVHPANDIHLTLEDIIKNYIDDDGDIHSAFTRVVSLENTLHGMLFPLDEIKRISKWCKSKNIKLHLDGARLWNASTETGISIKEYCSYFDSVSLCLSKSLGAPVGSVLVGSPEFIKVANHFKKQNGGGIRQAGLLTAMADIAIEENWPKIARSHQLAKDFGKFCQENKITLLHPVHTNFVFIDSEALKLDNFLLTKLGKENGIKLMGSRISFHFQISNEAYEGLKKAVLECYKSSLVNPYVSEGAYKIYNDSI